MARDGKKQKKKKNELKKMYQIVHDSFYIIIIL